MADEIKIRPDTPPAFLRPPKMMRLPRTKIVCNIFMHLSTNAGVKMNRVGVYPNGGHGFNILMMRENMKCVTGLESKSVA